MTKKVRLRKPAFDRENGILIAASLFHEHGYDAVSISDLTNALEINPPSLYAAYGSKAELFQRVLNNYVSTQSLPLDKIFSHDVDPHTAVANLFVAAAKYYTADGSCKGCLATEALKSSDPIVREMAEKVNKSSVAVILEYTNKHFSQNSKKVSDYIFLILQGLSSYARLGHPQKKLIDCAKMAAKALESDLAS